jgi:hypothetical protein
MNGLTEMKKLTIVYQKNHEELANMLSQLIIGAYDNITVKELDVSTFKAVKPTYELTDKIVFLGSKAAVGYKAGIKWHYDKFSMKYGWLGNRAVLEVGVLNPLKLKAFIQYAKEQSDEAEKTASRLAGDAAKAGAAGAASIAALKLGAMLAGIKLFAPVILAASLVALPIYLKQLPKYQYPLLIKEFVKEYGVGRFMSE